ncbi:hypothetical protein NCCP2716_17880 [Sporosarcina sp. NCCP-2716]|uniref:DUF378 domain-containing protein n=1 Tax=Sporosarcina sp. NCCP-2716 TaxID=2943679 RepID=UPI00203EAB1E|nr:DUF378 domain-containing protein [Sporosarcina sp. NCCP-2716]GKV69290.1 hypothetical protein NCCP2716_17880 [Sporosarcina sp. NCCP-2716]
MGTISRIALALVIIGALNWGLIGLFQFDLVATLFGGQDSLLARVVYTLVGISGIISLGLLFRTDEDEAYVADSEPDPDLYTNPNLRTEFGEEPDFSDPAGRRRRETDDDSGR